MALKYKKLKNMLAEKEINHYILSADIEISYWGVAKR